jgi:hypothetical protein
VRLAAARLRHTRCARAHAHTHIRKRNANARARARNPFCALHVVSRAAARARRAAASGEDGAPSSSASSSSGGLEEDGLRRSFEAPDVIDAETAEAPPPASSFVVNDAPGAPAPPPPAAAAASASQQQPWELWDDALAAAGRETPHDAARMDAAADAIAADAMRRTRARAEEAVDAWLLAVQRGSGGRGGGASDTGAGGAALAAPLRPTASPRELLLWAWGRKRARALRRAVAAARWTAAGALLATAGAQAWGRPALNERVLPWVSTAASSAAGRSVRVGRVRWLLPTGVTGLTPFATLGPCAVGPGAVEKSSLEASSVSLWLRPLASLLQRRAVLHATVRAPVVSFAQADNHSWLGYPDDTTPSSRPVPPPPAAAAPVIYDSPEAAAEAAAAEAAAAAAAAAAQAASPPPRVVLGSVALRDGACLLRVHGDAVPRRIGDVNGTLHLSADYSQFDMELNGRVKQRDPEGRQTTMLLSDKRHLRCVYVLCAGAFCCDALRARALGFLHACAHTRACSVHAYPCAVALALTRTRTHSLPRVTTAPCARLRSARWRRRRPRAAATAAASACASRASTSTRPAAGATCRCAWPAKTSTRLSSKICWTFPWTFTAGSWTARLSCAARMPPRGTFRSWAARCGGAAWGSISTTRRTISRALI